MQFTHGDRHTERRWADDIFHYGDVIMSTIASQITSVSIVDSTVRSGPDQRKHQSSASLAFVWGIHRGPVNSPHKGPVTRKMFPFDDVIMKSIFLDWTLLHFDQNSIKMCHQRSNMQALVQIKIKYASFTVGLKQQTTFAHRAIHIHESKHMHKHMIEL